MCCWTIVLAWLMDHGDGANAIQMHGHGSSHMKGMSTNNGRWVESFVCEVHGNHCWLESSSNVTFCDFHLVRIPTCWSRFPGCCWVSHSYLRMWCTHHAKALMGHESLPFALWLMRLPCTPFFWFEIERVADLAASRFSKGALFGICQLSLQYAP